MEQKNIPFETHQLPIEQVDPYALYILEKLKSEGFIAYLVGGSVRDLLLGYRPKDFDISTSAKPEEIKKIFRNCILIGRRFRLAHIRFGRKIFEVSTFRTGDPETEELILRDNQWGYPEEDAKRRDFTINGLFYDPSDQTIIDYVGGYEDLKKQLLRTIGQPYARFKQDPVRMLRLLKFQARFGFQVEPDVLIALVECREEIVKAAGARVLEEMLRMMESGASQKFIMLLTEHGLLQFILPQVAHFIEKEEKGTDIYSFLKEVDLIYKDPKSLKFDRSVLLSALTYPLLQKRLESHFLDREQIPHLGQIHDHTKDLLSDVYHGFFRLPRRLRVSLMGILTGQYRLTPLKNRKRIRRKIPSDPDFVHALHFLHLRSCLEPALQKVYQEWDSLFSESEPLPPRARPRKRKRRRKPEK